MSNRRTTGQARLWVGGFSTAAAAAAMIGMGSAHADDGDELLGQAGTDLTQAAAVLDQVPTSALDARELVGLQGGETLETDLAQQVPEIETFQDGLSAADQTSPLLLDADQQFLNASQEALTADQGFLSVVDAGDLNTLSGYFDAQLPLAESGAALYGGLLDVEFADLIAQFDPSLLSF